jgi:hypothetical protein
MAPGGYSGSGRNQPHVTQVRGRLVVDSARYKKKKFPHAQHQVQCENNSPKLQKQQQNKRFVKFRLDYHSKGGALGLESPQGRMEVH